MSFKKLVYHVRQPPFALYKDKQDVKVTVNERRGEMLFCGAFLCFMDEPVFGNSKSDR